MLMTHVDLIEKLLKYVVSRDGWMDGGDRVLMFCVTRYNPAERDRSKNLLQ